jgi:hypothetical protein
MQQYEANIQELARQSREAALVREFNPEMRASAEAQRRALREAYQRRGATSDARREQASMFVGFNPPQPRVTKRR